MVQGIVEALVDVTPSPIREAYFGEPHPRVPLQRLSAWAGPTSVDPPLAILDERFMAAGDPDVVRLPVPSLRNSSCTQLRGVFELPRMALSVYLS